MADIRDENGRKERLYLFYDGEAVSGKVSSSLFESRNNPVKPFLFAGQRDPAPTLQQVGAPRHPH